MLVAHLIIALCAVAEAAWRLSCWACARQTQKADPPGSQNEATFGRPSNATPASFGLSVATTPRISLRGLESGIDPSHGSSEAHGSPPRTTLSRLVPWACRALGFPSSRVPLSLLVHLLVCGTVSVSYLFPCEGAGASLGAALFGFGLCAGDAAALVLSFVHWRRARGWEWQMPLLSRAWALGTAMAWPLSLVWLDSGVAVFHLGGVAVWGALGVELLCTGKCSTCSGSQGLAPQLAGLGVYSLAFVVATALASAPLEIERALVANWVLPCFLGLHISSSRGVGMGCAPSASSSQPHALKSSFLSETVQLHEQVSQMEQTMTTLRAKAGCVSTLAHEVRTPLNSLLACCTMLGDTALEPGQRELLELMMSCGSQITNNVDYVLELSRLEATGIALQSKPF
eukprot:RCo053280